MLKKRRTHMSASPKMAREKLSTTVSAETYQFLQQMVDHGEAANLAEAVDSVVNRIRRLENRRRLADATSRYFQELPPNAVKEENELAENLSTAVGAIDFDSEI
jgi:hemerythrin-like domain-containing protein